MPDDLADALTERGMTTAFAVQAATIPDALAGRDICGRAPTGSGKTLAFGIPALTNAPKAKPGRPTALILSPTRELAEQIRQELLPLGKATRRFIHAVYGGVGYGPQIQALRKGVDILVACPGRLEDLIKGGNVTLADVSFVVVDEADRMADMGFLPVVKRLLDQTRDDRQTLLFSATLDGDIAELTRRYQNEPARHEVGEVEPDLDAMTHHFWSIRHEDRVDHTRDAVMAAGPTIVFTRTRHGADRLTRQLEKAGVKAEAIHGGRNQNQRSRALEAFSRGHAHALIATDVAARGIHVDGVACVVHFDPPEDDKTYLHRSGRTARAGAEGVVVSFVRPNNRKAVKTLQRDLGLAQTVSDPEPALLGDGSSHGQAKPKPSKASGPSKGGATRAPRSRDDHEVRDQSPEKPARTRQRNDNRPRNRNLYDHPESEAQTAPGSAGQRRSPKPSANKPRSKNRSNGSKPEQSGTPAKPSKVHRKGGGAKRRAKDQQARRSA